MRKLNLYNILNTVTIIIVTVFFSCKNNFNDVQRIGISDNEPIGVVYNFNSKYVDSGRVTAILYSPKMLDYTNRTFPFNEFPDGIILDLFDEKNNKSVIVSDYAIVYSETNLIDLKGNVKIESHTNDTLFAEQLYYDQKAEWLFTNKPVTFKQGQDIIDGNGFDSNLKFTNAEVLEITGMLTVQD